MRRKRRETLWQRDIKETSVSILFSTLFPLQSFGSRRQLTRLPLEREYIPLTTLSGSDPSGSIHTGTFDTGLSSSCHYDYYRELGPVDERMDMMKGMPLYTIAFARSHDRAEVVVVVGCSRITIICKAHNIQSLQDHSGPPTFLTPTLALPLEPYHH
jgi:hypothetical protein